MRIFSFLSDKSKEKEYQSKIEELEKKLKAKEKEVENLLEELEKTTKISPKQLQIFEKNINDSRKEATKYKKILENYKINPNKKHNKYRVDITEFYSKKEFPEILTRLEENKVNYLDELNDVKFYSVLNDIKKVDDAKKKYSDYKAGRLEWNIITLINKGDKLSKIFPKTKYKKLNNVFNNLCLEFMDDITEFDFNSLKIYDFSSEQVQTYKKIRDEYYMERIVKEVEEQE